MRILYFPGGSYSKSSRIPKMADLETLDVAFNEKKNIASYKFWSGRLVTYKQLTRPMATRVATKDTNNLLQCMQSDPIFWFLAERRGWNIPVCRDAYPCLLSSMICKIIVENLERLHEERQYTHVLFNSVPHMALTYIAYRFFEQRDVEIFWVGRSPIIQMNCLVRGITEPKMVEVLTRSTHGRAEQMIAKGQGPYEDAIPSCMSRHPKSVKTSFDVFKSLMAMNFRPRRLVKNFTLIKSVRKIIAAHNRAVKSEVSGRFVFYALHYQPEATTLPRAGAYCQQIHAISDLASACDKNGLSLAVKEHPTMFSYPWRLSACRTQHFYDYIENMHNVFLVDQDRDSFSLIDSAEVVATSTGTVGLEARIRGKPVVLLGGGLYKELPGVFQGYGSSACELALERSLAFKHDEAALVKGLQELERKSFVSTGESEHVGLSMLAHLS